ncbi:MAG: DUF1223 domain-containing protein [Pseudomonadota bacterium]
MIRFLALFSCLFAAPALSAHADKAASPVLVELFASQNCSACPKAHKTMHAVDEARDDIFILTWSVDYWDYLGTPDPLSLPMAKERQAVYAETLGLRAPYTPQSVYDGVKQCPGTRRKDVDANIKKRLKQTRSAIPELEQVGDTFTLAGDAETALEVRLVSYLSGETNTTTMVNPVTATRSLGLWAGQTDPFEVTCDSHCAVLLQKPDHGEVIAVYPLD